ncbi:MAG: hypothetical protein QUT30_13865 [Acidobacteriota bacterium]|jgi:hypothetical protein|nr:hypothetical protein [Acidobacteriota bacterium]
MSALPFKRIESDLPRSEVFESIVEQSRALTRQIAEAEAKGDFQKVDSLLGQKSFCLRMIKEYLQGRR